MGQVTLRVEHALGRAEALRRIQAAAEKLRERAGSVVRTLEWTEAGAEVAGDGFEGTLAVGETDVTGTVELGWKLAFFPLKVQREGEAWLRDVLQ